MMSKLVGTKMKKKPNYLIQILVTLSILCASNTAFAGDIDTNEKIRSLDDPRVPSRYLPLEKMNISDYVGYSFVDRTSVKLHPYNPLIRTYVRIINYSRALSQDKEDSEQGFSYRSQVIHEYVNCDKKEYARGLIQFYENYFGEGQLEDSNNTPKRLIATFPKTKARQNLQVICSLPLNN